MYDIKRSYFWDVFVSERRSIAGYMTEGQDENSPKEPTLYIQESDFYFITDSIVWFCLLTYEYNFVFMRNGMDIFMIMQENRVADCLFSLIGILFYVLFKMQDL